MTYILPTASAVHVDASRCTACGACRQECPVSRFHGYTQIEQVTTAACLHCGHCLAVCPTDALTHDTLPDGTWYPSVAPRPWAEVLATLRGRRSVRRFASRPVTAEHWELLREAMRHAPSGMNVRPVQAVVVTDPVIMREIAAQTVAMLRLPVRLLRTPVGRLLLRIVVGKAAAGQLRTVAPELRAIMGHQAAGGDPVLHGAPGLLILHAARTSPTGHEDCQFAAMSAMLAAPSVGLGTCPIGFVVQGFARVARLRQRIALPDGDEVYAVLAVGYPATTFRTVPTRPEVPVRWFS